MVLDKALKVALFAHGTVYIIHSIKTEAVRAIKSKGTFRDVREVPHVVCFHRDCIVGARDIWLVD